MRETDTERKIFRVKRGLKGLCVYTLVSGAAGLALLQGSVAVVIAPAASIDEGLAGLGAGVKVEHADGGAAGARVRGSHAGLCERTVGEKVSQDRSDQSLPASTVRNATVSGGACSKPNR